MDNTQNNILTLDMYEDLKEEIIKTLKSEVSKSQGEDNAVWIQKIEEIAKTSIHTAEQVANLTNRIGQIKFQPVINTLPSDNSGIKMLFKYIFGSLKQIETDSNQNTQGIMALQEQVAKMKIEVDTEKFEHLTNHTIYEMQQQIRYLKQPPIVLKIIIGLVIVALIATYTAGYYVRDRREWKDTAKYWYEQSQQNVLPKAKKK
ncbi:hypothetical protein [Alistipes finegoldii]|uniref:hypothetical protein n=1 Tax=Alistipes finegoldii TaxID=214856 RepID=UPI00242CAA02|nr:hypothetical protein [Alistipes finegoldii]